jgi:LAS seventeen-binding protein 1/2
MNAQSANAYIVAQTRENISFLQSTNQISAEDAHLILSKLPSELSKNPALRPPPPIPSSFLFRVRALWSYNEDGRVTVSALIFLVSFLKSFLNIGSE